MKINRLYLNFIRNIFVFAFANARDLIDYDEVYVYGEQKKALNQAQILVDEAMRAIYYSQDVWKSNKDKVQEIQSKIGGKNV